MCFSICRRSHRSQHRSPKQLPPELYGRVFRFVKDLRDLVSLCQVSCMFRCEAERVLYYSVDLSNNHLRLKNWCQKMSKNARLANLVHALTFEIVYAYVPIPANAWLGIIEEGLKALVNLKALILRKNGLNFLPDGYTCIIRSSTFRLTTFSNDMFDLEPILPFLQSQPDLTVWRQRHHSTQCKFSYDILPHLVDATVDHWILLKLKSRPLTRIATKFEREGTAGELRLCEILGTFGQWLLELELERAVGEGSHLIAEFIAILAAKLPLLHRLVIRNRGEMLTDSTTQNIAFSLGTFRQLTTLSLIPSPSTDHHSFSMAILSMEGCVQSASTFFRSLPSLERVALPTPNGRNMWFARSGNDVLVGDKAIQRT